MSAPVQKQFCSGTVSVDSDGSTVDNQGSKFAQYIVLVSTLPWPLGDDGIKFGARGRVVF